MGPPRSKATIQIAANLGSASQFTNSTKFVELKGRTDYEKGEIYLQLSLAALKELASLLEDERLSPSERVTYNRVYSASMDRYDEVKKIRNQLLAQKKSFRKYLVNLFVREPEAKRFYKVSYQNYASIRTTSDELHRRLLPPKNVIESFASGESTHHHVSVSEESPRDVTNVVEGNVPPPSETIRGINIDVRTEEEAEEVLAILNRIAMTGEEVVVDDDQTIMPSVSSRPPSPSLSCTIIYNYFNQSVLSIDSEVTGTTINNGLTEAP